MKQKHVLHALTCPTCGNAPSQPFRSYDTAGTIVSGCVDHFHSGRLTLCSATNEWHERPEAKKVRAAMKAMRGGFVTECA